MDQAILGFVICASGWVLIIKENYYDTKYGSSESGNQVTIVLVMVGLIISEYVLFGSVIGVVVSYLLTGASHCPLTFNELLHVAVEGSLIRQGCVFQNSLTIVNTNILWLTGLVAMLIMHANSANCAALVKLGLGWLVAAGTIFVVVQCCEYQHVYWSMFSSGGAMMFFVVTGLHGLHVLVGVAALGAYCGISSGYWVGSVVDFAVVAGLAGILCYWHFVDAVWVVVVSVVYAAIIWLC